jgi:uncharacterized membrane protein
MRRVARGYWCRADNATEGALMTKLWRLDSKSPELARAFRKATPEKQRLAVIAACDAALSSVALEDKHAQMAVTVLRTGVRDQNALHLRLRELAEQLDDEYFRLDETAGRKEDAVRAFSQARAAAALAFALSSDASQLHEALYEALSAVHRDPNRLWHRVYAALC